MKTTNNNLSGKFARYAEILEKGDENKIFFIAEDYEDGRCKVKDLTSPTVFGYSTHTLSVDELVIITDSEELETIAQKLKNDGVSDWEKAMRNA